MSPPDQTAFLPADLPMCTIRFWTLLISILLACPVWSQATEQLGPAAADDSGRAESDPASDTAVGPSDAAPPPEVVAVDDLTADQAIENRIQSILEQLEDYQEIAVTCRSGVVTLQGTAGDATAKEWASTLARSVQDVVAVRNQMRVASELNLTKAVAVMRDSVETIGFDFLTRLPLIAVGLLVVLLTGLLVRANSWLMGRAIDNRKRIRQGLKDLLLQLSTIGIWIVGLLVATVIIFPGMTPAKALTVLGLGSVAIGFAFKDIFENFFAGVLILWRYPFDRGDYVESQDLLGRVEEITIRNTMIRQLDGELAVVPNAMLFKNPVEVLTDRPSRRVRILCGIAYDEPVGPARQVIDAAVRSCQSIKPNQPVEVFANEFASSSINFEVAWWTGATPLDVRRSRDEVVEAIKVALDEAGIEIPFPYRTLTFKPPLSLQQGSDRPEGVDS